VFSAVPVTDESQPGVVVPFILDLFAAGIGKRNEPASLVVLVEEARVSALFRFKLTNVIPDVFADLMIFQM
jgi:hypothetical protein